MCPTQLNMGDRFDGKTKQAQATIQETLWSLNITEHWLRETPEDYRIESAMGGVWTCHSVPTSFIDVNLLLFHPLLSVVTIALYSVNLYLSLGVSMGLEAK